MALNVAVAFSQIVAVAPMVIVGSGHTTTVAILDAQHPFRVEVPTTVKTCVDKGLTVIVGEVNPLLQLYVLAPDT